MHRTIAERVKRGWEHLKNDQDGDQHLAELLQEGIVTAVLAENALINLEDRSQTKQGAGDGPSPLSKNEIRTSLQTLRDASMFREAVRLSQHKQSPSGRKTNSLAEFRPLHQYPSEAYVGRKRQRHEQRQFHLSSRQDKQRKGAYGDFLTQQGHLDELEREHIANESPEDSMDMDGTAFDASDRLMMVDILQQRLRSGQHHDASEANFEALQFSVQIYELLNNPSLRSVHGGAVGWVGDLTDAAATTNGGQRFYVDAPCVSKLLGMEEDSFRRQLKQNGFTPLMPSFAHNMYLPSIFLFVSHSRKDVGAIMATIKHLAGSTGPEVHEEIDPDNYWAASQGSQASATADEPSAHSSETNNDNDHGDDVHMEVHIEAIPVRPRPSAAILLQQLDASVPIFSLMQQTLATAQVIRNCGRCGQNFDVLRNTPTSCRAHPGRYARVFLTNDDGEPVYTGDQAWSCCHAIAPAAVGCLPCDHCTVHIQPEGADEAGIGGPSILL